MKEEEHDAIFAKYTPHSRHFITYKINREVFRVTLTPTVALKLIGEL